MTRFLGALTWFSSFTLSCTERNNYFSAIWQVRNTFHCSAYSRMVTRFTQEIIPFHLALCKFWKEKFITCFHFRSSSKSTYFPNRKILIQNSYLASSEMGSTPWTKWTWRFFLSFSNSNFHFLLNFEKIGDPNEPCMSGGILQVKIAFSSPLIGSTRRWFCEGNKFNKVTSGKEIKASQLYLIKLHCCVRIWRFGLELIKSILT